MTQAYYHNKLDEKTHTKIRDPEQDDRSVERVYGYGLPHAVPENPLQEAGWIRGRIHRRCWQLATAIPVFAFPRSRMTPTKAYAGEVDVSRS